MVIEAEIAGVKVGDRYPVRLMGVLNLGKESFYKGSVVSTIDIALERAEQMVSEGADFLDLGAMSTAPGVKNISEMEERDRLIPILKVVLDSVNVPISVDTFRSQIAEEALKLGARIINDVSSFKYDDKMVQVLKRYDAPAIIMATNKIIGDPLTMPDIIESIKNTINFAENQGYSSSNIVIDPGIGRWVPEKNFKYNLKIIKYLNKLSTLNCPILVGLSRKSFIHEILNRPNPENRLYGTLSATAISVFNGAHIIRTHDVGITSDVTKIAKALRELID